MDNRRRLTVIAVIVIAALALVSIGAFLAVATRQHPVPTLSSVQYSQSKAVPGWDDSAHTTTDPSRLTQLRSTLMRNGWSPSSGNPARQNGCAGGLTTRLALSFTDGTHSTLTVYECGANNDSLTKAVSSLISAWRGTGS